MGRRHYSRGLGLSWLVGVSLCSFCTVTLSAQQVTVAGRAVDENGAAVAGARIELRDAGGRSALGFSDAAGDFRLLLPTSGDYEIRAQRQGFYLVQGKKERFDETVNLLTITLNHQQEFSERVDVAASPPHIDPQQPAAQQELDNTEILAVPYAAPQDYRNALPMVDGVVADNTGRPHFNGGASNETSYTLDGFNLANPVSGQLDARMNIDSIQSMTVEGSRFAAANGRGSAGLLEMASKMGDDHWRFGGTHPQQRGDGAFAGKEGRFPVSDRSTGRLPPHALRSRIRTPDDARRRHHAG